LRPLRLRAFSERVQRQKLLTAKFAKNRREGRKDTEQLKPCLRSAANLWCKLG
jgi:hypothetical protein